MKKVVCVVLSLVLVVALLLPLATQAFAVSVKTGDGTFKTPIIPIDSNNNNNNTQTDPQEPETPEDPVDPDNPQEPETPGVTETQYEFTVTAEDGVERIHELLKRAADVATAERPFVINVEAGTYVLDRAFHIYSNTSLVSKTGVKFIQQDSGSGDNMLKVGTIGEDPVSGYGYENITVDGGDWNNNGKIKTMFKFCHAKNCTLKNVKAHNIKDAHFVEVAAVDGFALLNSTFYDMEVTVKDGREAIQIDVLHPYHISGYAHLYDEIDYLCKNIVIDGCTFKGTRRAIGSHTVVQGKYFENVAFTNNKFVNTVEKSILCYNLKNLTITGNEISGNDVGIELKTMDKNGAGTYLSAKDRQYDNKANVVPLNAEIANNTVISKENHAIIINGIKLKSAIADSGEAIEKKKNDRIPAGDYYVENVNIHDNTLTAYGKFCPIKVQYSKNVTVSKNTVTAATTSETPIYITDGSSGISVTDNTIKSTVLNGIRVCNFNSNATYPQCQIDAISGNSIAAVNSSGYGIRVSDAKVTAIDNNTVTKSGNLGIQADKNVSNVAVYVGSIKNNVIGPSKTAIKTMKASVGEISDNKIGTCTMHSIQIDAGSVVQAVKNHVVPNSGQTAIVIKSAKVTEVSGNTITSPKMVGIHLYESSTVGTIDSNKITGAKTNGIAVKKSKATQISNNTISKSGQTGIYCYESGSVDKIIGNTVNVAGLNGINVNIGVVKAIENNVVKSCKNIGIYLNGTSKTQVGSIKGNTIQSCTIGLKILQGPKANLYSNTLIKNGNGNKIIINGSRQVKTGNLAKVSKLTAKKSGSTIKLTWAKKGVSGYYIYRSTKAVSGFAKIGTANGSASRFIDKKAKAKTTYYYRVTAYYKIPGSNVMQYADATQSKGVKR